jgi:NRPS condensation-like uncharacterized protein
MKSETFKMNSIDFLFFSQEDIVTSQGLFSSIRFKTRHSASEIRKAMRYMLTVYPRLRSIAEPTMFSYRMRVLDDSDPKVDILFDEAFKVRYGLSCDTADFLKYRRDLLNEPFALQQSFPIKIRYIPDDPMPMLFISVHHMIYDGSGWLHLLNSLMSYLNGVIPPIQSAEEPSIIRGFLERPFYKVPQQILNSIKADEKGKKEKKKIIHASERPVNFYGPMDIHIQNLSHDLSTILAGAKRLNCSMTVLVLSALSMALNRKDAGDLIWIEMPIDLRPYMTSDRQPVFGNYVMAPVIKVDMGQNPDPLIIVETIKDQINKYLKAIENKQILPLLLTVKLSTFLGKKVYAWTARVLKERGIINKTCLFSNVGNFDNLNRHGDRSQVVEAGCGTSSHALLIVMNSLNNAINLSFSYQEAEFTREEIIGIIERTDRSIAALLGIKKVIS